MRPPNPAHLLRAPPRPLSRRLQHLQPLHSKPAYSTAPSPAPPPPPSAGRTPLPTRRLISIHGPDAPAFLNGLATAPITTQTSHTHGAFYNAFLNAQGRVLSEGYIWRLSASSEFQRWISSGDAAGTRTWTPGDAAYMLEVDEAVLGPLSAHLRRHKLRARLGIRVVEAGEWGVWAAWTGRDDALAGFGVGEWAPKVKEGGIWDDGVGGPQHNFLSAVDTRAPGLGHRLLVPPSFVKADFASIDPGYFRLSDLDKELMGLGSVPSSAYTIRRYLAGVPEGAQEIQPQAALPQESMMDVGGALDFKKGCYVGQELTIRTHHTGVVRKRILPCVLYDSSTPQSPPTYEPSVLGQTDVGAQIPSGTDIKKVSQGGVRTRAPGKWLAGHGNIGLAMVRVENMTDVKITEEGGGYVEGDEFGMKWAQGETGEREIKVKAFVPEWQKGKYRVSKPRVMV